MVADAQAASMIGYVTMGMSLVPMIGPVIGGVLDDLSAGRRTSPFSCPRPCHARPRLGRPGRNRHPAPGQPDGPDPHLPALFASRRFWGYTLAAAFASGCFFAYLGGAPYVGDKSSACPRPKSARSSR
jgi:MFS transporter, DHA1 family, multidrug resistance protein